MRFYLVLCALTAASFSSALRASDADPLTQRREILSPCFPDAAPVLNGVINNHFKIALRKVNRKKNPTLCDLEEAIYDRFKDKKILGISLPIGPIEKPIDRGRSKYYRVNGRQVAIPSINIDRSDSIYADAKFKDSPGLVIHMASQFKINNLVIGSDKLSHFFGVGYDYLKITRDRGVRAALQYGVETEEGFFGLSGNQIFSYADLASNYSGYVFWCNLTHPKHGHFTKRNGKWVQCRSFRWQRYVNPAWDEAINIPCGPLVETSKPRVSALVRTGKIPNCPPIEQNKMPCIEHYYPSTVLPWILHPTTLVQLRQMNTRVAKSLKANLD